MEQVKAALDAAQWKEIVSVQAGGPTAQAVNLVATLDATAGGLQWMPPIQDHHNEKTDDNANNDDDQLVVRHLQAKQWIMPMLNDVRRNQSYHQAIRAALQQLQSSLSSFSLQTPIRVLDLGCGTGLLGMMAAQACPTAHVTSMDMSCVMVTMAQRTLADNINNTTTNDGDDAHASNLSNIHIVQGHSTQMYPIGAHLCVSELLEDGLLGEGWIPAMRDAWQRHLYRHHSGDRDDHDDDDNDNNPPPPPVVIPRGATVQAQLLQGAWLRDYVGPRTYNTTTSTSTIGFSKRCDSVPVPTAVIPMHVHHLIQQGHLQTLSEPVHLLEFDVSCADRIPGPEGRQLQRNMVSHATGTVHAILVWWNLELYPGITYELYNPHDNTACDNPQDHWHPCVHVLENPVETTPGQSWMIQARHDDYTIQVSLVPSDKDGNTTQPPAKRERTEVTAQPSSPMVGIKPGRVWQLNQSTTRLHALERGITEAVQEFMSTTEKQNTSPPPIVLDMSDFCIGALLAAAASIQQSSLSQQQQQPPWRIFSLERVEATAAVYAIQANGLQQQIQVLQGHFEQVTAQVLLGIDPDVDDDDNNDDDDKKNQDNHTCQSLLVVAEPAYTQLHYWPHLEAINYYYVMRGLHARLVGDGNDNTVTCWTIHSVPHFARLYMAALQAPELAAEYGHNARQRALEQYSEVRYHQALSDLLLRFAK